MTTAEKKRGYNKFCVNGHIVIKENKLRKGDKGYDQCETKLAY